jgi:anti-sigma B factor antagonist
MSPVRSVTYVSGRTEIAWIWRIRPPGSKIHASLTIATPTNARFGVMPLEPLQITDEPLEAEGQRVLRLTGPITLTNLFEFQDTVRADTSRALMLELSGVPYVDSAAIGVLVGAYVSRQKNGRVLALVAVTDRVRTTLNVTQVEKLFQFYSSVTEAQSALGASH